MTWTEISEFEAGAAFGYQSANKFWGNEIYLKDLSVRNFELDENISAEYVVDVDADGKITKSAGPGNAVGVLMKTGTIGQTKPVALLGSKISGFTGKTPGDEAYVDTDGSITTTANSYPIGCFISETELLITKDRYTKYGSLETAGGDYIRGPNNELITIRWNNG